MKLLKLSALFITDEERLVAELECLGIHYLSRQTNYHAEHARPSADLLASLVCQPSARVRGALIAILLAHPEFEDSVQNSLQQLSPQEQDTFRSFYTAAMLLQQIHTDILQLQLGERFGWLPDFFSSALGLSVVTTPAAQLIQLGKIYQAQTGMIVNWTGT